MTLIMPQSMSTIEIKKENIILSDWWHWLNNPLQLMANKIYNQSMSTRINSTYYQW